MLILTTERLNLRTVNAGDAPFYLELVNEPAWIAYIGDRGLHTVEAARTALLDGPVAMQLRQGFSLYLVERRSDGVPVGLCGLLKRDFLPGLDIGYAVASRHRGQGYAYEAAAAVMAQARDQLQQPRLLAITHPDNHPSIALLEKLGMRFVERKQLPGYEGDSNVYCMDF